MPSRCRTGWGARSHHSTAIPSDVVRVTCAAIRSMLGAIEPLRRISSCTRAPGGPGQSVRTNPPLTLRFSICPNAGPRPAARSRTGTCTVTRVPHRCSTRPPRRMRLLGRSDVRITARRCAINTHSPPNPRPDRLSLPARRLLAPRPQFGPRSAYAFTAAALRCYGIGSAGVMRYMFCGSMTGAGAPSGRWAREVRAIRSWTPRQANRRGT